MDQDDGADESKVLPQQSILIVACACVTSVAGQESRAEEQKAGYGKVGHRLSELRTSCGSSGGAHCHSITHGCFTCVCLFAVSGLELRSCPGAHAHLFANLGYAFGQA